MNRARRRVSHGPRTATATAPTRLLVVTAAAFQPLLERLAALQSSVLAALAARLAANAV